ncbi:MAG: aldehyde ferredoxin oxidoreductase C-terminal domain-containing protein [Dehalococcoidales bacterium]|nr:aldehyde ferredoxin oxidoreductase C-terminal domain-containing protein [Dehalococcoidales bacterium]
MESSVIYGYTGNLLRVDLSLKSSGTERFSEDLLKTYLGGAALGIKYIYDEVKPGTEWFDPENRLFLGAGPLSGTRLAGTGSVALVSKGAMTNGMSSTQANGFFGAFLRFSGFDAMIVQGQSPSWVYLYIHDGQVEIKDATHLLGQTTSDTERLIKEELDKRDRQMSVLSIGPAGENLVRFSCPVTDGGHVASHNGMGAVMGSKKLKAIAVARGASPVPVKDKDTVLRVRQELLDRVLAHPMNAGTYREGTVGGVVMSSKGGVLPVKNYTTGIYAIEPEKLAAYTAQNLRTVFQAKPSPCWACGAKHCHVFIAPEGKYAGRILEEPEYEGMAAFSSAVGVDDAVATVILANEADRLGMDVNECGWVCAFVMECYEKRLVTKNDLDGLEMTWGNSEALMEILQKTATRQGFGAILAEGVMRAAQKIGGEAVKFAVGTQKYNTPRGHDHRVLRFEQFDTSVSNLGTLESHSQAPFKLLGMPETYDAFDPDVLPFTVAKVKGAMVFEDSLVTCRFQTGNQLDLLCQAVNAVTGWEMDIPQAVTAGKRAVNLARIFNINHGIDPKLDAPSMRYGSAPLDGPAAGRGVMPQWDRMLRNYYGAMGWDEETGIPLPDTLKKLDLDFAIQ